jgi:hypothetical protein
VAIGKIVITESADPILITGLEALGFQCDYLPGINTGGN